MNTQEPITFHTTAQNIYAHINTGCFGATTDSEQVFLYHAFHTSPDKNKKSNKKNNQEKSPPIDTKACILEYQCDDLLKNEYKLYKNSDALINAAILRSISYEENEEEIKIDNITKKIIQKSKMMQLRSAVGLIIHIHTTRELCQSCAYSLGNELPILHSNNSNERDKKASLV